MQTQWPLSWLIDWFNGSFLIYPSNIPTVSFTGKRSRLTPEQIGDLQFELIKLLDKSQRFLDLNIYQARCIEIIFKETNNYESQ